MATGGDVGLIEVVPKADTLARIVANSAGGGKVRSAIKALGSDTGVVKRWLLAHNMPDAGDEADAGTSGGGGSSFSRPQHGRKGSAPQSANGGDDGSTQDRSEHGAGGTMSRVASMPSMLKKASLEARAAGGSGGSSGGRGAAMSSRQGTSLVDLADESSGKVSAAAMVPVLDNFMRSCAGCVIGCFCIVHSGRRSRLCCLLFCSPSRAMQRSTHPPEA